MKQTISALNSLGRLRASFWVPVISCVILVAALVDISLCPPKASCKSFSLGDSFSLAVGESASLDGDDLTIKFIDVIADSRCPTGVQCIWQGEVACLVEINHSGTSQEEVLTHPGLTQELSKAEFGSYRFAYGVEPYPEAGKEIEESEYRLNLSVTKVLTVSG